MRATARHVESKLGAYALGALEPQEAAQVEAHLRQCRRCRSSLDGYRGVAEGLLFVARSAVPPPSLRADLKRKLTSPRARGSFSIRPNTRGFALPALTGVMATAVVALGWMTWQAQAALQRVEASFRAEQAVVEERARVDGVSLSLLTYPQHQVAMVSGERAYGTVLFEPRLPMAVLNAWGLPELPGGDVFQVWLVRPGGERISAGTFVSDVKAPFTRVLLDCPEPLANYSGLGVTIEPQGGSPSPTGPRVLTADF